MKGLFLFVFILSFVLMCGFVATHAFPETVIVETSEGKEKEIYVPDKYEELREAYLEVIMLYLEESSDLEKTLKEIDSLLILIDDMDEIIETLRETNKELADELTQVIEAKQRKELFQGYLSAFFARGHTNGTFDGGAQINVNILEKVNVGVGISLNSIQLFIGWRIF